MRGQGDELDEWNQYFARGIFGWRIPLNPFPSATADVERTLVGTFSHVTHHMDELKAIELGLSDDTTHLSSCIY